MDCVFGFVGNGFAFVAADTAAGDGILLHKNDEEKIMYLDSHKLIAATGERGDRVQFTEYVQKHVSLYRFRNGIPLTTAAAANFTRGELADAWKKNPHSVNILMAGYDEEAGASLYSIDYLGTLHKVDKGAFGYGSYLFLSTMDRYYRSDMSFPEAFGLLYACISEIKSRLVTAPPNFVVKIVNKSGACHFSFTDSESRDLRDLLLSTDVPSRNPKKTLSFSHSSKDLHKPLDLHKQLDLLKELDILYKELDPNKELDIHKLLDDLHKSLDFFNEDFDKEQEIPKSLKDHKSKVLKGKDHKDNPRKV